MGYAAKCYFTDESSVQIKKIWDTLANAGLATFLKDSKSRPGLTLGLWDSGSEDDLSRLAKEFADTTRPPVLTSYGIGTFTTAPAQVFLGVVGSNELMQFHRRFHSLNTNLTASGSHHYLPGSWVPHSTFALRCPVESVSQIIETCLRFDTRILMEIGSIGIVETVTVRSVCDFPFIGS